MLQLSHGQGPILEIQICVARVYAAKFTNNKAHIAALHENTNPQIFILSSGARHRPVKTKTSIPEWNMCTKNETKENNCQKN